VAVARKPQVKVQEQTSAATFGAPEYLPFAKPSIDEETINAVAEVLRSGWITTGPRTARFEAALSEYFGGRTVKTFTSATTALEIALRIAGIGPGDEVITTDMSFAATANVILRVGAKPVLVDVDLATRNIDFDQVEAALTSRTRALMPVHFAGRPVDMQRLYDIARKHSLRVIEDAAHAMGASWQGRRIGSFGDLVVFSFHPNKNMTTIEGGALVLDDEEEARKVDLERFHGIRRTSAGDLDVVTPGGKSNFADVSAVIGLGQLARLEAFNARRRELAQNYFDHLNTEPGMLLPEREDEGHAWHIFSPLLPLSEVELSRSEFVQRMHERGIGVSVHYPAIHTLELYRNAGFHHACPNAERIGRETVSLPLFPDMNEYDVERVCNAARAVIASAPRTAT
jgi:dTDP-4-amino-4,6-dideoxygalactose transaminase